MKSLYLRLCRSFCLLFCRGLSCWRKTVTLFVASKICELYPAIYDVCLCEFFNVRSFRCLMFWGLSMSRREYNDDNDDARLELRNDHDNTRRASIKLRWRQRRWRIKGVNCKQHSLTAPYLSIQWFIYWMIYWLIHSFMFMAVPLQKEEFRFASKHRWRQGRGEMKIFITTLCAATVCFA